MFESLKKKLASLRGKGAEQEEAEAHQPAAEAKTAAPAARQEVAPEIRKAVGDSGRKIDQSEVEDILWELELGLLESDVALPVVEEIKEGVRDALQGKHRNAG